VVIGAAIVAVAAVAVAIAASLYSATRVTQPITALTQVVGAITAGNLDQRARVRQGNEIGLLATGFNTMTDQLQQTLLGLEQTVGERTAALRDSLAEREQTLSDLREALDARDQLNATVRELSSPVLPVLDGVLVMPLIGVIDSARASFVMQTLLQAIEVHRAHSVLIDVTGVPLIDTMVAAALLNAASAVRLLGAEPMLVGIRPELAQTLVGLGIDLSQLITHANLQSGLTYTLTHQKRAKPRV